MRVITYSQFMKLKRNDYKSWLKLPKKIRNLKQPFEAVLIGNNGIKVLREL